MTLPKEVLDWLEVAEAGEHKRLVAADWFAEHEWPALEWAMRTGRRPRPYNDDLEGEGVLTWCAPGKSPDVVRSELPTSLFALLSKEWMKTKWLPELKDFKPDAVWAELVRVWPLWDGVT